MKIGETLKSTTHHKIDEQEKASRNTPELKEKDWEQKLQSSCNKVGLASHNDIHMLQLLILQLDSKLDRLIEENQQLKRQLQNKP